MCDEHTTTAEEAALAARGVSRRDFAALGAAATLVACAGTDNGSVAPALVESTVRIPTPDGTADAFFVHPAKGRHPGVILWPDIFGMRDAFKVMARRLAAAGYAVSKGFGFVRQVRTKVSEQGGIWRADAVYTISPNLPDGLRTIDAEVTMADCTEQGIPTG